MYAYIRHRVGSLWLRCNRRVSAGIADWFDPRVDLLRFGHGAPVESARSNRTRVGRTREAAVNEDDPSKGILVALAICIPLWVAFLLLVWALR